MDNNPTFDVCNHAGDCDYADGDMVEDDWTGTSTGYSVEYLSAGIRSCGTVYLL